MKREIGVALAGLIGLILGGAVMPLMILLYHLYGGDEVIMPQMWAFLTVVFAIVGAVIGCSLAKR